MFVFDANHKTTGVIMRTSRHYYIWHRRHFPHIWPFLLI